MIIGLISDTFIPDKTNKLPKSVFKEFTDVDLIIHAGNLTSLDVKVELEKVAPFLIVQGNRDREYGNDFPESIIKEIEGIKVGVKHGEVNPKGDMQQLFYIAKEMGVDVLISGHTQQPMIEQVDEILLLNPGSPTAPIFADPTVMILTIEEKEIDVNVKRIS